MRESYNQQPDSYLEKIEELEHLIDHVSVESNNLEKRSRDLIISSKLLNHSLKQDIKKYSSKRKII